MLFTAELHGQPRGGSGLSAMVYEDELPPNLLALAYEARNASETAALEPLIRRVLETLGHMDAYPLPRNFWALAAMDPRSLSFPQPLRPELEPRILDALSSEQVPLRLGALLVFHPQTYGPAFSPGFQNAVLAKLTLQPAHANPRVHAATVAAVLRLGQMNRSPDTIQRALEAWMSGLRSGSLETKQALLSWLGRPDPALLDWNVHPDWTATIQALLQHPDATLVGGALELLAYTQAPLPPTLAQETKAALSRRLLSNNESDQRRTLELTLLPVAIRGNRTAVEESRILEAVTQLLKSTNALQRHAVLSILAQTPIAWNGTSGGAPVSPWILQLRQDSHPLVRVAAFVRFAAVDTVDAAAPAQADVDTLFSLLKTPMGDASLNELLLALQRPPLRPSIQERMLDVLTECLSNADTPFRRRYAGKLAAALQAGALLTAAKPTSTSAGSSGSAEARFQERLQLAVLKGVRDPDGTVRLAFLPRLTSLALAADNETLKPRIQLLQSIAASDPFPQCRAAAFTTLIHLSGQETAPLAKTRAQTAVLALIDSPDAIRLLREAGASDDPALNALSYDRFRSNPTPPPSPSATNPAVEALALKLSNLDTVTKAAVVRLLAHMHRTQTPITADARTRAALRAAALSPDGATLRPALIPLLLERPINQNGLGGMAAGVDPQRARRFGLGFAPTAPAPPRDLELALLALHGTSEQERQAGLNALANTGDPTQGASMREQIAEELYKAFTKAPASDRGRIVSTLTGWFPEGNVPHMPEIQQYWLQLITNPKTPEEELIPAIQFVPLTSTKPTTGGALSIFEPLLEHTNATVRQMASQRLLAPIPPGQPDGLPWTPEQWTRLILKCLKDSNPSVRGASWHFIAMAGEYGQPNPLSKAPPATLRQIQQQLETPAAEPDAFQESMRLPALLKILEELNDQAAQLKVIDKAIQDLADGPPGNPRSQWLLQLANTADPTRPRNPRLQSHLREQLTRALRSENKTLAARALELLNQIAMNGLNDDLRSVLVDHALKLLIQSDPNTDVAAINSLQPHLPFIKDPKTLAIAFESIERRATNRPSTVRSTALQMLASLPMHQTPNALVFEKRRFDAQLDALDDADANVQIVALECFTMNHGAVEDPQRRQALLGKAEKQLQPGPKRIPASVLCASLFQQKGDHERAAQILETALPDAEPGFPMQRMVMQLASIYEASQKFEKAIELLERFKKNAPPQPGMHAMEDQQLLRLYRRAGRQSDAAKMMNQNLSPSNVQQLIHDALNRNDPDAVIQLAERILTPAPAAAGPFMPMPQAGIYSLMPLPRRLAAVSTNHLQRLTALVRVETERQPAQQQLQQLLFECFDAAGDQAAAVEFAEQALKSKPSPMLAARLASAYAHDPKWNADARLESLSKAVAEHPDQPAFRKELALSLARIGRLNEARATLRDATSRTPGLTTAELAEMYLALGDFKEALEAKNQLPAEPAEPWVDLPGRWNRVRALTGQPPVDSPESSLGREIRRMGVGIPADLPHDQALQRIRSLLQSNASPQEKHAELSQLALPFHSGRWDLFFPPLEAWANAHPDEDWLPRALVSHALAAQLPLKALAWVERVERNTDAQPITPDIKAELHWLAGNNEEALKWFQRATAQSGAPRRMNAGTLRSLIRFHLVQGDPTAALETFKQLQTVIPEQAGLMGDMDWPAVQLGLAARQVGALKAVAPEILNLLSTRPDHGPMFAGSPMSNPARHDALELAGRYREAYARRLSNDWWRPAPTPRNQEGIGKPIPPAVFQDLEGKRVDTADWKGKPTLIVVETLYAESNGNSWGVLSNLWQRIPSDRLRVAVLETPTSNLGTLRLTVKETELPSAPSYAPTALLEFLRPSKSSIDYYLLDSHGRLRFRFGFSEQSSLIQEARALCLEETLPPTASISDLVRALNGPDALTQSEAAYRLTRWNGALPIDALDQSAERLSGIDRTGLLPRLIEEAESANKPQIVAKWGPLLLQAAPNNYARLNQLTRALVQLGKRDQALKWVESTFTNILAGISNQMASPSVIAPLVMAYTHERLAPELAVRFASNAVQVAPGIALAHQLLGRALMAADRPAEALLPLTRAAAEELIALESPAVSWALLTDLAAAKSVPVDLWKQPITKLRKAVDNALADPPLARFLMAELLKSLGDDAGAQPYFDSAGVIPAKAWTYHRIEHPSPDGEELPAPPSADVSWTPVKPTPGAPALIPFPPNSWTGGISYYRTKLTRKTTGAIRLQIGSSSQLRLWMDGKSVFEQPAHRQLQLDQDTVDLPVTEGVHEVLAAVVLDLSTPPTAIPSAGKGFYLRIEDVRP